MSGIARIPLSLLFSLLLFSPVFAQTRRPNAQTSNPIVTATTSNGKVRYASLGEVNQTRLQVFSKEGTQVYDSEYRLGNLIDWPLLDQQGQHLTDGSYLFLITVKDFSALLTQKYGTALLENDQVSLQQIGRDELPPAQALALQANKLSEVLSPVDRIGAAGPGGPTTAANDGGVVVDVVPSGKPKPATISQQTPVGENVTGTGVQNKIAKWTDNFGTLGDSSIYGDDSGNVGIGTTSPSFKLDVNGGGRFASEVQYVNTSGSILNTFNVSALGGAGLYFKEVGVTKSQFVIAAGNSYWDYYGNAYIRSGFAGPTRMTLLPNGNVGFGTTAPVGQFVVSNAGNSGLEFFANVGTYLQSYNRNTSAFEAMSYYASSHALMGGNVGIGTTTPSAKLDVNGDLNVTGNAMISGNIAAKYQDVAEWVQARQPMAPGTVVSLDSTRSNAVTPSRRAYDSLIAGVVSAQPGVILGEGGGGKVMVATSGRVMVKVDASKYPIRIGDLLVASNRPGVAMRSRPIRVGGKLIHRPGTIIGKALEALPNGAREILVLVSLQ
jgi:hypothetical protein